MNRSCSAVGSWSPRFRSRSASSLVPDSPACEEAGEDEPVSLPSQELWRSSNVSARAARVGRAALPHDGVGHMTGRHVRQQ